MVLRACLSAGYEYMSNSKTRDIEGRIRPSGIPARDSHPEEGCKQGAPGFPSEPHHRVSRGMTNATLGRSPRRPSPFHSNGLRVYDLFPMGGGIAILTGGVAICQQVKYGAQCLSVSYKNLTTSKKALASISTRLSEE